MQHESLGHLNCFLSMALCCQYWNLAVSSINKELFSHYKVKIITTFFSISYKSQTERKNSHGRIWSNLCEKIVPMSNLSPAILPLEQIPTSLTSSVKRLWVKFNFRTDTEFSLEIKIKFQDINTELRYVMWNTTHNNYEVWISWK